VDGAGDAERGGPPVRLRRCGLRGCREGEGDGAREGSADNRDVPPDVMDSVGGGDAGSVGGGTGLGRKGD
jgi:hypothetical protein